MAQAIVAVNRRKTHELGQVANFNATRYDNQGQPYQRKYAK